MKSVTYPQMPGMSTTLDQSLQTLEEYGLIRLAATHPELEYWFRHALVQEATYQTLVRADRRHLHQLVGEVLERMAGERSAAVAPLLAHHFDRAGDETRATTYYLLAGDQAARVYANAESIAHYTRALGILSHGKPETKTLDELYKKRGRALELSGQYDQAFANYEAMRDWARGHDDRPLELAALIHLAQMRSTSNPNFDAARAEALAQEALQLAEQLGDREAQVKILWNQVNLSLFSNRTAEAVQVGERALHMARELGLREPLAYIANDLARVHFASGQPDRALDMLGEASRLWREMGNVPMLTDSLSTAAQILYFVGRYEPSLALAGEAFELSRSIHNRWGESYSMIHRGQIYWDWGEPSRAIEALETCIRLSETTGFSIPKFYARADLALVYGSLGAVRYGIALAHQAAPLAAMHMPAFHPHALARLTSLYLLDGDVAGAEQAMAAARQGFATGNPLVSAPFYQAEIELALAQGNAAQALQVADEFSAYLARTQVRNVTALASYLKGEALLAGSRIGEARTAYEESRQVAESLGQRRLLWPVLLRLSELALRQAQPEQAAALRRQAREIVTDIAAHTSDELRASFLALPAVRVALDE